MRDSQRIVRILGKIGQIWQKYPDFRLTQLLVNAIEPIDPDLFYYEDDRLEEKLDEYIEKYCED